MQPGGTGNLPLGCQDPREAVGCRGRSRVCPSPPAPPQPLGLPRAAPLCLSSPVSSLVGASQRCPRAHSSLSRGALPRWTYQELVVVSEPPHCSCFWGAGTAPPGSLDTAPGLMFSRAGPSLATGAWQVGCGCQRSAAAPGGPERVPPARCWGAWAGIPLQTGAWWPAAVTSFAAGCHLKPSREPRGQGLPLFWHRQGRSCRVALCNTAVAMIVATANTCVVG